MIASIEPELQKSPPRGVRRREGLGFQNGCVQLFLLPHTIVGIGMLGWALLQLIVLAFGTTVPGTLYDVSYTRGSKGGYTYHARYEYRFNGTVYTGKGQISASDYRFASTGQAVQIKLLPMLPETGEVLLIPGGNPRGNGTMMLLMALFWNAFLSVFYIILYGPMWKAKTLVRNGIAVRGRVVDKQIQRGKNTSYLVHYEYMPLPSTASDAMPGTFSSGSVGPWASSASLNAPSTPIQSRWESEPVRTKMTVLQKSYDALNIGDEVTVLHDARKPKRSVLYVPCGYVAQ
jgi:hypothetical protein